MRRLIDIVFALIWLVLMLPLMLSIAVLIKIDSHGTVFYKQQMVGWRGKEFSLFRFRTMYGKGEKGFTRVGCFIRNVSLDHLPQLLNLLHGDLTLIGPRPMEVNVVNLQDAVWKQYVQVKPGLFNYAVYKLGRQWTSSRASDPNLNQELELEYLQKRSVISDLRLFSQFMRKFLASRGNIKARGDVDSELKQK